MIHQAVCQSLHLKSQRPQHGTAPRVGFKGSGKKLLWQYLMADLKLHILLMLNARVVRMVVQFLVNYSACSDTNGGVFFVHLHKFLFFSKSSNFLLETRYVGLEVEKHGYDEASID